ncbi:MAG: glycosyltransferase family 9 protein [Bacteriovoracales bacterium]|nr:glycosyltransferase family 9 protein [Bacteriovoracales bacterium]
MNHTIKKILIIQTAFIGDVILATSFVELVRKLFPNHKIHVLVRKGNEEILEGNPSIYHILTWNKGSGFKKFKGFLRLIFKIRREEYDFLFNLQRFSSSTLLTLLSRAKKTIGFDSHPLSVFFHHRIPHRIPHPTPDGFFHETQRNALLLKSVFPDFSIPKAKEIRPRLFFSSKDHKKVQELNLSSPYFVLAPTSVWATKKWSPEGWKELICVLLSKGQVLIIGSSQDLSYTAQFNPLGVSNLCGRLSLKQSALVMEKSAWAFVQDSAALHLASAVNVKTTAFFCSTVPDFGFFPLSDDSKVVQLSPRLDCMPCGIHGKKSCPLEHFRCSLDLKFKSLS